MKILLIYNKKTAHKVSAKKLGIVESMLRNTEIDYDIRFTQFSRHAIELVAEADFTNYDAIVGAGGDGTLFELINGYFKNKSKKRPPIAIIPVGTGNAFSHDIGFGKPTVKQAVEILKNGKTEFIDLGLFSCKTGDWYFANILGMGFVTDVQETAAYFKHFGNTAYSIGVFHRLLKLKTNKLNIEIDGKSYNYDAVLTEISNSKYTANYLMAPNAKLNDGLLDVTIAKKMSRMRLIKLFSEIFTGKHIFAKEVETFQAKEIKISMDEIRTLAPDGEIEGETPVHIKCVPNAIEMFVA